MPRWSEEDNAFLRARAAEGLSSSKIKKAMAAIRPGVSRSAICGQCARLGIKLPGSTSAEKTFVARRNLGRSVRAKLPPRAPKPPKPRAAKIGKYGPIHATKPATPNHGRPGAWTPLPGAKPVSLIDRTSMQCAWPVDVPSRPAEQMYCGGRCADADTLQPYCAAHRRMRLARYVPASLRDAENAAA